MRTFTVAFPGLMVTPETSSPPFTVCPPVNAPAVMILVVVELLFILILGFLEPGLPFPLVVVQIITPSSLLLLVMVQSARLGCAMPNTTAPVRASTYSIFFIGLVCAIICFYIRPFSDPPVSL